MDLEPVTADAPGRQRRRAVAGLAFAIYLALLGAFFLPFASASCQTDALSVHSEVMTGWELVSGHAPVLREGPGDPDEGGADVDPKWEVEDALLSLSRVATVEFVFAVDCLLLAFAAPLFNSPRPIAWGPHDQWRARRIWLPYPPHGRFRD